MSDDEEDASGRIAYLGSDLTVRRVLAKIDDALHEAFPDINGHFTMADAGTVHIAVSGVLREVLPSPWLREER